MSSSFELIRRTPDGKMIRSEEAAPIFGFNDNAHEERWAFVVPHDDDVVLGAGLLLQYAHSRNIHTEVLITSDGSQGYTDISLRDTISPLREKETRAALQILNTRGTPLRFPDGNLHLFSGRRVATSEDDPSIQGYTGLQNSFTFHMRRIAPTRVFLCTSADIHPDHQVVHRELLISLFHAAGTIWPELGAPLKKLPSAIEMAVYCPFPGLPDICLNASDEALEKKLQAIAAFQSQTQIEKLVARMREGGAVEYFRELDFNFYSPDRYRELFAQ